MAGYCRGEGEVARVEGEGEFVSRADRVAEGQREVVASSNPRLRIVSSQQHPQIAPRNTNPESLLHLTNLKAIPQHIQLERRTHHGRIAWQSDVAQFNAKWVRIVEYGLRLELHLRRVSRYYSCVRPGKLHLFDSAEIYLGWGLKIDKIGGLDNIDNGEGESSVDRSALLILRKGKGREQDGAGGYASNVVAC